MLKRFGYLLLITGVHWWLGITWMALLRFSLWLILVMYVALPLAFRYLPVISRNLVFLPFLHWPMRSRFDLPDEAGLRRTRNFYLTTDDGIKLGIWHVLPESDVDSELPDPSDVEFERSLSSGAPVVFYNHGNSGSRAGPHRVELYRVLSRMGYHVLTFDYRGYADSTPVAPSETGVVADSRFLYKWLRRRVGSAPLIVWGHSLGTGVTSHMVADLCDEGDAPSGLVLESPFNNIEEEVTQHNLTLFYRQMPGFAWFVLEPLKRFDIAFQNDVHVARITVPLMIMHAEDDGIIPHRLAVKLHNAALVHHPADRVQFHSFDASHGYGHKYICRSPLLPDIVREFVERSSGQ